MLVTRNHISLGVRSDAFDVETISFQAAIIIIQLFATFAAEIFVILKHKNVYENANE